MSRVLLFNAGVPSGAGPKGTFCLDTTNADLYVNTDGATAWAKLTRPETANSSTVTTTDATQTTVATLTLLDENTYHVKALVVGVQSTGGGRASYEIDCTVYRTGAGSATLQGSVTSVHANESDTNWDATFTVSGNDLRVSVTGVAATTVKWDCTLISINRSN